MVEQATRQMERLIASWPPPPDSPGVSPPKPGHIVVDAIRVEMTKAHSKLDPAKVLKKEKQLVYVFSCLLYTSPSPRDATLSRMPSSA